MSKEAEANGELDAPVLVDTHETDRKPPSCCLCMDVRIGTVMIGLFNLVCHAFWIISLTSYFVHQQHEGKHWKILDRFDEYAEERQRESVNHHHMVAMVVATLSFLVVFLLIFGAALRRSNYILPFFCMQIFDICLTVLIAATVINYAPQLKLRLEMTDAVHGQCIQRMSLAHFRMLVFSFWMFVLLIKYYFASVVWDCYNHCKKLEERRVQMDPAAAILLYQGDMETMNLLPSYDDVVKTSPPPYQ